MKRLSLRRIRVSKLRPYANAEARKRQRVVFRLPTPSQCRHQTSRQLQNGNQAEAFSDGAAIW